MALVGVKIKEARLKANMSQFQLAKKAGVQQAYISYIEQGRTSAALKIAAAKVLSFLKLDISSETMILSIPSGAKRAEMASCPHCNGTGQTWKFFN